MKVRRGVGPLLVVAAAAGLVAVAGAGAERRLVTQDEPTKWRFSFKGVSKLGSRVSGSGTAAAESLPNGRAIPVKASGKASHLDVYFGEDERLSLTVTGLSAGSRLLPDAKEQFLVLKVSVKSSNHPESCAAGEPGMLALRDGSPDGSPDSVRLRICGREHEHNYVHNRKYPVQVAIEEVVDPADVQAILTVNGYTVQHGAIGYSSILRFKHGTKLRIEASAAKRLPSGWRMVVFSEHDPLNGKPPMVYDQYHILCELGADDRECEDMSRPSTFPLNQGGCHRVAAEITAPNPGRRVSSAAVCLTPVP